MCTALAGEMLGMKMIYMDGGSGAQRVISKEMVSAVRSEIYIPLIVGGGINSTDKAIDCLLAGADIVVIGNATEKNPNFISEVSIKIKSYKWI